MAYNDYIMELVTDQLIQAFDEAVASIGKDRWEKHITSQLTVHQHRWGRVVRRWEAKHGKDQG